ncbi:unnamed protein product [Onchocerca flexuosa]|uniref:Uncharacterized protein n=1 Tax=Onchocerca flexuosa TaxID=387005 RepID=A0A183HGX9_9BILA|nr:unnamed protein product [Onchocerca flexuosa]
MDQNNLIPTRSRVEYPTLFTASDLTCAGSAYTPTPAQLLLSSSELLQPPATVQSTNSMFKSTVLFDMPENSTTDQTLSATINDYTHSMHMITGDNAGAMAHCSNTSGSTDGEKGRGRGNIGRSVSIGQPGARQMTNEIINRFNE